jgi:hypothetical protein
MQKNHGCIAFWPSLICCAVADSPGVYQAVHLEVVVQDYVYYMVIETQSLS